MTRAFSLRAVVVVTLLLPGLVMAAPIAGPCGLCGDGDACHMKRPVERMSESSSCCGEAPAEAPPEPSLSSSNCECGRDAPPAVIVQSTTSTDTVSSPASTEAAISPLTEVGEAFSYSSRPPAPPPAPPAYLIDCAFLT
jgi:hypothetical protein